MMVKRSKSEEVKERAINHGMLFIKRDATIRSVAKETGFNKSTIHLDLHRLKQIHPALYEKVEEKLKYNFETKHIRGGETTQKRYGRKNK